MNDDLDVDTVTCPAGVCSKQVAVFDYDRMFGHLLVAHGWTFDTAQSWIIENMPDDASEQEEILVEGDAGP